MYDGIREFAYPDSAYVDCTRWLLSPKTTSKIKRLFSVSQYNTLTLYDGSDIYKSTGAIPIKNIKFVCRQSHFKIISATVFSRTSKKCYITKTDIAILMHFHHSMSNTVFYKHAKFQLPAMYIYYVIVFWYFANFQSPFSLNHLFFKRRKVPSTSMWITLRITQIWK